ncbi:MAG: hypothetical protein A2284_03655 [Deltaproteobacteria bacterium RIFOXYA12_FULL_61_11]|nr:MAG: hypothetical protein A2284_03655 [Deltaproteobacteria bacterium RIFOXYA12_FULL_61_11]
MASPLTSRSPKKLLPGILLFSGFFLLYLHLNQIRVASVSFYDQACGADTPVYVRIVSGAPDSTWWSSRHPLVQVLLVLYSSWYSQMSALLSPLLAQKLPFALCGAGCVVLVYALGLLLGGGRLTASALALFCGCSGSFLFFATTPESGIVSTFFSTAYLCWVQHHRDRTTWGSIAGAILLYCCAVLSDILCAALVVIPLAHAMQLRKRSVLVATRHVLAGFLGLALAYTMLEGLFLLRGENLWAYYSMFTAKNYYCRLVTDRPLQCLFLGLLVQPLALPSHTVAFAQPMYHPPYFGYFEPTITTYGTSLPGTVFLFCLIVGWGFLILRLLRSWDWLSGAYCAMLGGRLCVLYGVAPHETFLVSAPLLPPLAVILTMPLLHTRGFSGRAVFFLLAVVLAACNLPFFIP